MSYSICNVLAEATISNILRWVPFDIDEEALTNRIANKMIRPTTIPQSLEDLKIEQAIAREALRLSFIQHKSFAVSLKGVQTERTISDAFEQAGTGGTLVDMMALDLLIGSGGVLSHAPRRNQAARMMIDAFLPEGITELAVDSIFMMPQLGVLANIQEDEIKRDAQDAALHVFDKDCLIRLGTCIAPVGRAKKGRPLLKASLTFGDGGLQEYLLNPGEIIRIELPLGKIKALLEPEKGIDVGAGPGEQITANINGGAVGIILDGRGRPLALPDGDSERMEMLNRWSAALEEYPD